MTHRTDFALYTHAKIEIAIWMTMLLKDFSTTKLGSISRIVKIIGKKAVFLAEAIDTQMRMCNLDCAILTTVEGIFITVTIIVINILVMLPGIRVLVLLIFAWYMLMMESA